MMTSPIQRVTHRNAVAVIGFIEEVIMATMKHGKRRQIYKLCSLRTYPVRLPCGREKKVGYCSLSKCEQKERAVKEWDSLDDWLKAIIMLSGLTVQDTDEIAFAVSHFKNSAAAISFAEKEIERYTCSNFSMAWFYERVKDVARGNYSPFVFRKTVAQQVAEKLNIAYFSV